MRIALLFLFCALFLPACGPQPQDCARSEVFCAGLVTDFGSVSTGIRHQAWLGLQDALAAQLVDRVDFIETIDARDRAANIDVLTEAGYDVIVTVGSALSDETMAAASTHPRLLFIGVEQPQDVVRPNLAGLVFHEEYSGYLAGALAARLSEGGHVGAVCDAQFIDPMRRYCEGFRQGARAFDPHVDVRIDYRDGAREDLFNDAGWGQMAALRQVAQGTDVLFAAGGRTAEGALQAAAASGIDVIGAETDLYPELESIRPMLVTSATNDVRSGVLELVRLAGRGEFPAGEYFGSVKLAPWHEFNRRIPADLKQEIDKLSLSLQQEDIPLDIPYKNP
jgi:basic membrane protein A and related proteins